jgi:hypothetical protein
MYNIPNSATWVTNVQGVSTGELIQGGAGHTANIPVEQLTKRTNYLLSKIGNYSIKSANYAASSGDFVFANTSSAAWTLTLPSSPSLGDKVTVVDYDGSWDTNNLTIARNGHNINGTAENLTCDVSCSSVSLIYVNSTVGWKVV